MRLVSPAALLLLAAAGFAQTAAPPPKVQTGPEPGAPIPAFSAPDSAGRARSLADLTGPKGLMLVFFRSADW